LKKSRYLHVRFVTEKRTLRGGPTIQTGEGGFNECTKGKVARGVGGGWLGTRGHGPQDKKRKKDVNQDGANMKSTTTHKPTKTTQKKQPI